VLLLKVGAIHVQGLFTNGRQEELHRLIILRFESAPDPSVRAAALEVAAYESQRQLTPEQQPQSGLTADQIILAYLEVLEQRRKDNAEVPLATKLGSLVKNQMT